MTPRPMILSTSSTIKTIAKIVDRIWTVELFSETRPVVDRTAVLATTTMVRIYSNVLPRTKFLIHL